MYTDLLNPRPDAGHWLPIVGFKPLLDSAKLKPGNSAGVRGKRPEVITGRPKPEKRLTSHALICKYSYSLSSLHGAGWPSFRMQPPAGGCRTGKTPRRAFARRG